MEIRRSYDRLISTMGFPILVRSYPYIESGPRKVVTVSQYMAGIRVCLHCHIGRCRNKQVLLLNKRHYIYSEKDPILQQLVAGNTQ